MPNSILHLARVWFNHATNSIIILLKGDRLLQPQHDCQLLHSTRRHSLTSIRREGLNLRPGDQPGRRGRPGRFRGFEPNMARMTAEFHIAFNAALALVFIRLLDPLAWPRIKILPARTPAADPAAPRHLDESALDTPSLALADAAREALHMGDLVEVMLRQVMTALTTNDRALAVQVSRMDNAVDRLDEAIKLYVTKLKTGRLSPKPDWRRRSRRPGRVA